MGSPPPFLSLPLSQMQERVQRVAQAAKIRCRFEGIRRLQYNRVAGSRSGLWGA